MFKDRLKQLRIDRGLSQVELADALEVSPGAIGGYENGTRTPKQDILDRMAEFFQVPAEDIKRGRQLSPDQYAEFCYRISDAMNHTSWSDFEALGLSEYELRTAVRQKAPIREDRAVELAAALGTNISDLLIAKEGNGLLDIINRKLETMTTPQLQKVLTYIDLVKKGEL